MKTREREREKSQTARIWRKKKKSASTRRLFVIPGHNRRVDKRPLSLSLRNMANGARGDYVSHGNKSTRIEHIFVTSRADNRLIRKYPSAKCTRVRVCSLFVFVIYIYVVYTCAALLSVYSYMRVHIFARESLCCSSTRTMYMYIYMPFHRDANP